MGAATVQEQDAEPAAQTHSSTARTRSGAPRGWRIRWRAAGAYTAIVVAAVALELPMLAAGRHRRTGSQDCPCLDRIPALENITINTISNQATRMTGVGIERQPVDDCLLAESIDSLQFPGDTYCYPTDYGRGLCHTWDKTLLPECAHWAGDGDFQKVGTPEECKGWARARETGPCQELFEPKKFALPWCQEEWCYVDPRLCNRKVHASEYFPGRNLWYSYGTCDGGDYFEIWGSVQLDMCENFGVVEKPYAIMWLACWACAFMQQVIDATRAFEEQKDRLSRGQRGYMAFQLVILITETFANVRRINWDKGEIWSNYNLYVYVFINSSVFVRATMMSQAVWDWYNNDLLKNPVLPFYLDNKGWTDGMRALLLVMTFQFVSSMGVFAVICLTHLAPALIIYHWIFLVVATGLVKSRQWTEMLGLDPEGRFGRALVMGTNSFLSCMGTQVMITAMVRTYAGEWYGGYFAPLRNDFLARRASVYVSCHLGNGVSLGIFEDQDFMNLFLR